MHGIVAALERLGACREALRWVRKLPSDTTPEAAYTACECPDWLVWLAREVGVDPVVCRRAALPMVRAVLPVWEAARPDNRHPHVAVALVERVLQGETIPAEEVSAALEAVQDVADATDDDESAQHAALAAMWLVDLSDVDGSSDAAIEAYKACPAAVAATLPEVRAILPWSLVRDAISASRAMRALGITTP